MHLAIDHVNVSSIGVSPCLAIDYHSCTSHVPKRSSLITCTVQPMQRCFAAFLQHPVTVNVVTVLTNQIAEQLEFCSLIGGYTSISQERMLQRTATSQS